MDKLLVSACLLGTPCRYDGKSKADARVQALVGKYEIVPVCPEQLGGLPTPRVPSERRGERVVTAGGRDVTEAYRRGAEAALALCQQNGCEAAVLKEKSPSCGCGQIYDGTFSRRLIAGDGVTVELFKAHGIVVCGEDGERLLADLQVALLDASDLRVGGQAIRLTPTEMRAEPRDDGGQTVGAALSMTLQYVTGYGNPYT